MVTEPVTLSVRTRVALVVFAGMLCAGLYAPLASAALLGFDAFPLVAAAREGRISGAFTDELMGGRYPDGRFYRPLIHLSIGLDDLIGRRSLAPAPFRVTDIAIAALAATVLGALAAWGSTRTESPRRAVGALVGGLVAIALYAGHSAQLDVVPYAPRRADALATLFVAAAVLATLRGARPAWLGALALAALWSKESGVIAPPLIFVAGLLRSEERDPRAAVLLCLLPTVTVIAGVAARFAVLGELGGHAESSAAAAAQGVPETARAIAAALAEGLPGDWPVALLAGLIATVIAWIQSRRCTQLMLAWLALALVITSLSGRVHAWYALPFLAPIAVLFGVAAAAVSTARAPELRLGGALAALLAVGVVFLGATHPQREVLGIADRIAADQTQRFEAVVRASDAGTALEFYPWVLGVEAGSGAPPIYLHGPYSLKALAELLRPELDVAVVTSGDPRVRPAPKITLVPGPPPANVTPR